jgi:hypothetical protein
MTRNKFATQGACLVAALKRRPMTYAQMHALGLSTSPQKRVMEWLRLHDGWRLDKPKRHDGLVQWRVVKDCK